jgi:hypothetical protein
MACRVAAAPLFSSLLSTYEKEPPEFVTLEGGSFFARVTLRLRNDRIACAIAMTKDGSAASAAYVSTAACHKAHSTFIKGTISFL